MVGTIRFGQVTRPSRDKGPYRNVQLVSDGKPLEATVVHGYGIEGSPPKDSLALIFVPDEDEAKAVAIILPPPKDRQDGLKEGEVALRNSTSGTKVHLADNGDLNVVGTNDLNANVPGNMKLEGGGNVTIKAAKIVLDGVVYLGGEDGALPIGIEGTLDTANDALISALATKVYAK